MQVDIYVQKGNEWVHRATVDAKSENHALRTYGISGSRPRLGQAVSKSGKRFCAVAVDSKADVQN